MKKNIFKTIIFTTIFLAIIFLFSSCVNQLELIADEDGEVIFTYQGDRFIFMDSKIEIEEMKNIIYEITKKPLEVLLKNSQIKQNNIDFIINNNDVFHIEEGSVSVPRVIEEGINLSTLYLTAKIYKDKEPSWLYFSLANYLLEKGEVYLKDDETLKKYILSSNTKKTIEFFDENFMELNTEFILANDLGLSFLKYIEKNQKGKIIDLLSNSSNFKEVFGRSEKSFKSEWLFSIDVSNLFYNEEIYFIENATESQFLLYGYNNVFKKDGYNFYFSSEEYENDDIYIFLNKYFNNTKKIDEYFKKNDFIVPKRELSYIITTNKDIESRMFSAHIILGIGTEDTVYLGEYINNHVASPVTSWLRVGFQGMLENRYNEDYNMKKTYPQTANEILSLKENQHLLSFDSDYFIFGNLLLDHIKKIHTLSVSFVEYLEKEIGEIKLVELYTNEYDFSIITGKSLKELEELWLIDLGISKEILDRVDYSDQTSVLDIEEIKKLILPFEDRLVYHSSAASYYFPKNYLGYNEMWEFITLLEDGINDVKAYLGYKYIPSDERIEYHIFEGEGASFSTKNKVILYYVKEKKAEYIHETVHILTGYENERFISEGLCTYLDIVFSKYITPPAYGQSLDVLAKEVILYGNPNLTSFNDAYFTGQATQKEHTDSYILASSLVKYIEKEYGRKVMIEIHDDLSISKEVSEKTFEEIKEDWIEFLKNT